LLNEELDRAPGRVLKNKDGFFGIDEVLRICNYKLNSPWLIKQLIECVRTSTKGRYQILVRYHRFFSYTKPDGSRGWNRAPRERHGVGEVIAIRAVQGFNIKGQFAHMLDVTQIWNPMKIEDSRARFS
jgi:RNA:NAD 2'-phosphotransferase (TPT1/KptA family)